MKEYRRKLAAKIAVELIGSGEMGKPLPESLDRLGKVAVSLANSVCKALSEHEAADNDKAEADRQWRIPNTSKYADLKWHIPVLNPANTLGSPSQRVLRKGTRVKVVRENGNLPVVSCDGVEVHVNFNNLDFTPYE